MSGMPVRKHAMNPATGRGCCGVVILSEANEVATKRANVSCRRCLQVLSSSKNAKLAAEVSARWKTRP